jgi:hypothetical protein
LKSQEIKSENGLAKSALIRDHFDAEPLIDYSAINRLAANLINKYDTHPVDAVNQACDLYIKPGYKPAPVAILENVYKADKRLEAEKRQRSLAKGKRRCKKQDSPNPDQLSLFDALPPAS